MPQMMPINWIISLLLFIFIFILFNMMNYFIYNINFPPKYKFMSKNKKILTWKW